MSLKTDSTLTSEISGKFTSGSDQWTGQEVEDSFLDIVDSKLNKSDAPAGGFQTFQTLTDGATVTWNCATSYNAKVTIAGNRSLAISNASAGSTGILLVTQDGSGFRLLSLPANSRFPGGYYSLSTIPSGVDMLIFVYDGTNYHWTIINNYKAL